MEHLESIPTRDGGSILDNGKTLRVECPTCKTRQRIREYPLVERRRVECANRSCADDYYVMTFGAGRRTHAVVLSIDLYHYLIAGPDRPTEKAWKE